MQHSVYYATIEPNLNFPTTATAASPSLLRRVQPSYYDREGNPLCVDCAHESDEIPMRNRTSGQSPRTPIGKDRWFFVMDAIRQSGDPERVWRSRWEGGI